ncbi:MAG: imidazoleglycerol-phosphate dehydratase HisB [Solobacterium sp.]|jgi:imidazoleglycerol-phosphate dehydratase|nr:imidazoleglycerol-phosphate dehydratase HisB [Solobacterium sp.]
MTRTAELKRTTAETDIYVSVDLDGNGETSIASGIGFLDHMLVLLSRHSGISMTVTCNGDTEVDDHHSTEDIGIALGTVVREALGDKKGIRRYGTMILPMDEALVIAALDISGRGGLYYDVPFLTEKIGTFDTELVEEFMHSFAMNAGITLHLRKLAGTNSHHVAEACFKGLGRALREAVSMDERFKDSVPSTKGVL